MFETEKEDGVDFILKVNHHIHEKWMDFRRNRNKWRFGLWGRFHMNIAWTPNGVPYWNYPPEINTTTGEMEYDKQELIVQQINKPSFGKRYRANNGSTEWGYTNDAWAKPNVEGKSSRKSMKAKAQWWLEANEYLYSLSSVDDDSE